MAEREQNWYPISWIGYFTDLVREGIDVTRGQIELFTLALDEGSRIRRKGTVAGCSRWSGMACVRDGGRG
ncbi:hypothetical protein AB0C34_21295 [Nocardia sp. NPDC049220]|uniref:hypothetical protein n=1 Tax=Nocardia sp. NPDC049220 TaxID=3155273 RepID=UPI0033D39932